MPPTKIDIFQHKLFIFFDNVNKEKLKKVEYLLALLFKRFNLRMYLFFDTLENANQIGLDGIFEAGIEQVHISGGIRYLFSDTLALASRNKDQHVIVCDANYLYNKFTKVIRFIFDSKFNLDEEVVSENQCGIFRSSTFKLRHLNFDYTGLTLPQFLSKVDGDNHSYSDDFLEDMTDDINRRHHPQVFISEFAANRMHGVGGLLKADFLIGDLPLNKYKTVYLVNSDGNITVYDSAEKNTISYLNLKDIEIDIYPGPNSVRSELKNQEEEIIFIPRPILTLRKRVGDNSSMPIESKKVGYIMSNYNKERYISGSIFSIISQPHENISLLFSDDVSTDNSRRYFEKFIKYVDLTKVDVRWKFNDHNRGTYWIRNDIIHSTLDHFDYYFINDSDDYSSLCRTKFQLEAFSKDDTVRAVIVDIVRTDANHKLLSMNNEIERYGTATTAFSSTLIKEIGYFQNFRKNSDTEFIARIKTFISEKAIVRAQYPGLFQSFDGSNLTSDIYTISDGSSTIEVSTGMRGLHDVIWRRHHSRLTLEKLVSHFCFPQSSIPKDYFKIDPSFFVGGYLGFDDLILFMGSREKNKDDLYRELLEQKHTLLFREADREFSVEKKGKKRFAADLPFMKSLKAYINASEFSGYIMSYGFIKDLPLHKISPGTLLRKHLSELIYQSKSKADSVSLGQDNKPQHLEGLDRKEFFVGSNVINGI